MSSVCSAARGSLAEASRPLYGEGGGVEVAVEQAASVYIYIYIYNDNE
jgi:hypothetical protein